MGAEYCNEPVCVCVCLCLLRSYLRNYTSDLHQFFLCVLSVAVAWSCFGGAVIRYVFLVCFTDDVVFAHKLRLLDVAARLRQ